MLTLHVPGNTLCAFDDPHPDCTRIVNTPAFRGIDCDYLHQRADYNVLHTEDGPDFTSIPMPSSETLERFIARVEQNAHAEAIAEFYTPGASMQDNQSPPRVGRDALIQNERSFLSKTRSVTSRCVRPVFVNGDHVIIRWVFEFEWLDGRKSRIEELTWQQWEGEFIAAETFFFDPAQRLPK